LTARLHKRAAILRADAEHLSREEGGENKFIYSFALFSRDTHLWCCPQVSVTYMVHKGPAGGYAVKVRKKRQGRQRG